MSFELIMLVVLAGAVVGWAADRWQYGTGYGLAGDATIGAIGAAIGLWAFPRFGVNADPWTLGSVVAAAVGAVALVLIARVAGRAAGSSGDARSSDTTSDAPNLGRPAEAVADATARSPNLARPAEILANAITGGPNLGRPAEAASKATSRAPNLGKPAEAAADLVPSRGSVRSSQGAQAEPRRRTEQPEPRSTPQRDVPQPRTWFRAS